jgi:DNA-binding NarL/FixJ family response regulator
MTAQTKIVDEAENVMDAIAQAHGPNGGMTRVVILAEHRMERAELRQMLSAELDINVVADFRSTTEALLHARRDAADIIVVTTGGSRHRTTRSIRLLTAGRRTRRPAVLVITHDREDTALLLMLGASGVVVNQGDLTYLAFAVRLVVAGHVVIAPIAEMGASMPRALGWMGREIDNTALRSLTPREREVLTLVATGHSNAEISTRLSLSENTVKFHMQRLLAKLGLHNRASAVVFAYETGLIQASRG